MGASSSRENGILLDLSIKKYLLIFFFNLSIVNLYMYIEMLSEMQCQIKTLELPPLDIFS
jgi:hypothetical protein